MGPIVVTLLLACILLLLILHARLEVISNIRRKMIHLAYSPRGTEERMDRSKYFNKQSFHKMMFDFRHWTFDGFYPEAKDWRDDEST